MNTIAAISLILTLFFLIVGILTTFRYILDITGLRRR